MDFRTIFTILKGDVPGHKFHGNQWLREDGGFDPNGRGGRRGGNRAPAPQRAAAVPKPPRAPRVAKVPAKVLSSLKTGGKFLAFKSKEIAKTLGAPIKFRGAFNKGIQHVEMKDGSQGAIKLISGLSEEKNAKCAETEILAGKVGEALGFPFRETLPVASQPDQVLFPWIEGGPPSSRSEILSANPDNAERMNQILFFDQLTQNGDRFSYNGGQIVNHGNFMVDSKSGLVYGIDNAFAFGPAGLMDTPDFSLLSNPSQDSINKMYANLVDLKQTFASAGRINDYNNMLDRFRTGFVNYVPA
jgi:hypothetical protein